MLRKEKNILRVELAKDLLKIGLNYILKLNKMEEDKNILRDEDLAGMVKRGFDSVDERFDKIDGKLNEADGRFDKIDGRFDRIESDLEDIKNKLDNLERRTIFLEDRITEHSKILNEHSEELKDIKFILQELQEEKEVDTQKIVWIERRINRLEVRIGI